MSEHRPFSELTKDFTERRQRIEAKKAELREAMPRNTGRQLKTVAEFLKGETAIISFSNRQRDFLRDDK